MLWPTVTNMILASLGAARLGESLNVADAKPRGSRKYMNTSYVLIYIYIYVYLYMYMCVYIAMYTVQNKVEL